MNTISDLIVSKRDRAIATRVRRVERDVADIARSVAADLIFADVQETGHAYLVTRNGKYRMAAAHNSDNQTELREHERCGATVVNMASPSAMVEFFHAHGVWVGDAAEGFYERIRDRWGAVMGPF